MSTQMKTFIDRFSDLITYKKDLGRKLENKKLWILSCGSDQNTPEGFEVPFKNIAQYFQIKYGGLFYRYSGGEKTINEELFNKHKIETKAFGQKVLS